MSGGEGPERRRRRTRTLLKATLAVLAVPVLLELGLRVALLARGEAYSAAGARAEIERLLTANRDFVPDPRQELGIEAALPSYAAEVPHLHPFLGFEAAGEKEYLEDELAGFAAAEAQGRYVVLILGGSVAQIFGQYGTAALARALRSDPRMAGERLHFVRMGRGGYKQPQQALFFVHLLSLGIEPDAVINLDGFNEVALGAKNAHAGAHPGYPSFAHWAHLAVGAASDPESLDLALDVRRAQRAVDSLAEAALARGDARSAVVGTWTLRRLRRESAAVAAGFQRYSEHLAATERGAVALGPRDERWKPIPLEACTRIWSESSRAIHDLCAARGIRYLHVLQPTLHDPGAKPMTADERRDGGIDAIWKHGVVEGYPRLREEGGALAERGVAFLDASRVFAAVEETLYFDSCHFGERGCEILAEALAGFFLETLPPQ